MTKEALAKPAQEGLLHIDRLDKWLDASIKGRAQPAQKPVAWIVEFENGEQELHFDEQSVGETITPLYTTPPQRPWVGLTDEEKRSIWNDGYCFDEIAFANAVEAKLREKNT